MILNYPAAIVIAAALIAGAIVLTDGTPAAKAGSDEWVPIGASERAGWALNSDTGEIRACGIVGGKLKCFIDSAD